MNILHTSLERNTPVLRWLTLTLSISVFFFAYPVNAKNNKDENPLPVALVPAIMEVIKKEYVDDITESKLTSAALDGMLRSLDAHSGYLSLESFKDLQESAVGAFGGLGIEVTMDYGFVKIIAPIDGSPAQKAGLMPGDFITHVENHLVYGMSLSEAVDKMRGKNGTPVKLTIKREGQDFFEVTVNRSDIKYKTVRWDIYQNVGYIRIASFMNSQTSEQVKAAIQEMKIKSSGLKGVIIDLRNNPGGLLLEAINVSSLFISNKEIVSTRSRDKSREKHFDSKGQDIIPGTPIVILINTGSASAAEIMAGALQDHHRAVIMGVPSFGKGSVQTIIPLPNNYGAISMTTARYYTPSGRSIQAEGIQPDIYVEQAKIEPLSISMHIREKDMHLSLKPQAIIEQTKHEMQGESLQKLAESYSKKNKLPLDKPSNKDSEEEIEDLKAKKKKAPYSKDELKLEKILFKSQPELRIDSVLDYQLSRAMDLIHGLSLSNLKSDQGTTNLKSEKAK